MRKLDFLYESLLEKQKRSSFASIEQLGVSVQGRWRSFLSSSTTTAERHPNNNTNKPQTVPEELYRGLPSALQLYHWRATWLWWEWACILSKPSLDESENNKTRTYEEPTWLLWLGEGNVMWGAKLYINRHNGDEEKLVNGHGSHQDSNNIYEAFTGFEERTCVFCSTGMCVPCRWEEGKGGEPERGWGRQEDRQCPLGGLRYSLPCCCILTASLYQFNLNTAENIL